MGSESQTATLEPVEAAAIPVSQAPANRLRVVVAFFAIYVIWGSTYLAIRYAVAAIPPLYTAGFRHLIAGTILLVWALVKGQRPTWSPATGRQFLSFDSAADGGTGLDFGGHHHWQPQAGDGIRLSCFCAARHRRVSGRSRNRAQHLHCVPVCRKSRARVGHHRAGGDGAVVGIHSHVHRHPDHLERMDGAQPDSLSRFGGGAGLTAGFGGAPYAVRWLCLTAADLD